ncbi:hypothetical protein GMD88_11820 [Pseudoflavonifractor sp. BIOML-A6]|nr:MULTISPECIES: C69 family dipeptidase [unclassified Pseudoflavonifractor]MTQ95683.1 hypothetical protein [Pseudoflavonifractor sp. BIOML-A16]MTR05660.1 hypothetical protein [Pseudoflavonifractor sp. BIOML-A15]MTR32059.1 hypothetical protein [Pseudoflavonifractor sp. BIOML-A14]MTR73107.1 hypothetical protein [Pseudoflavonifractor sp. BIOML-A18]MTS65184.1 hypothetical protein [Pseudoflavonifractor sp. BIOML-A5]MTS71288.1 hypothetical protein [Pseudoflavonifractor sp. BIOML-A8]
MCFSVIVGRNASAAGHVLLAANDDWPGCPGHVHHVPRRAWDGGDTFLTVKGTPIPQVPLTYGYTYSAAAYETGTRRVSWADGVNDQRVAVSMQGVYAFADYQKEGDLLECDDLVILMLERGRTARQAIETAGELIARYGYSVSTIDGAEGTVCMAVADPEEGFFLELGPGGYWCARRVSDDQVECRPNCFGIGEVDFEDHENFLCSPGLYELAVEKGLVRSGEKLNFAAAFGGDSTDLNPGYGGALNPVNTLRKWRVFNKLGGLNLPPEAPVYGCVPREPVTLRGLMDLMRDGLEGTEYSLGTAPEAGRFHNPFWMEISTSIAQGGTVVCMIADLSPALAQELGCPVWFAFSNARLAPFVPCYTGGRGLPEAYQRGECGAFNPADAWWAFQETAELCCRNYEAIAPVEVVPVYEAMEDRFFAALARAEDEAVKRFGQDPEGARDYLAGVTGAMAEEAMETALKIGRRIKGKYLCNTILEWI